MVNTVTCPVLLTVWVAIVLSLMEAASVRPVTMAWAVIIQVEL